MRGMPAQSRRRPTCTKKGFCDAPRETQITGGRRHRGARPVHPDRRSDRCDGGAGRRQTVAGGASCRAGETGDPGRRRAGESRSRRSGDHRRWLAANLRLAERRDDPRLSAAGGELGASRQHLVAYSAVSQRAKSGDKPAIGTIKIEAETQVSVPERLVSFQKMKIVEANFQTLQKEQIREITTEIDKAIPDDERVIALDRVLANLDKSQVIPKNVEGVKADPPTIFFSTTPAVIMNLDGEPIWSPIKENDLKFAVNTNWDLFQYAPTNTLYLRNNDTWLKATDVKGTWSPAGKLPGSFTKLPAEENWKDVKANLPGKAVAGDGGAEGVRQPAAGGADPVDGRAGVSSGAGHRAAVGQQHRERRVPDGHDGSRVLPRRGPLVHGGRLHRAVDVRDADLAGRLQEDPARARALARPRVGPRDRSSHRSRAPRGDSANRSREQERDSRRRTWNSRAIRSSRRSRRRRWSAP